MEAMSHAIRGKYLRFTGNPFEQPASEVLAQLDVVRQLRRARQHIEALVWGGEIMRLKGCIGGCINLPFSILPINLLVVLAIHLVHRAFR